MVTFETVRQLVRTLPEAEESTWFGTPAFKVRGKSFARLREEGDVLVVKVDIDSQQALIQLEPDTYFITPHYAGYPYVLVRLPAVHEDDLRALLVDAWRLSAPKRLIASFDAAATAPPP
jgi:hypothetical protein